MAFSIFNFGIGLGAVVKGGATKAIQGASNAIQGVQNAVAGAVGTMAGGNKQFSTTQSLLAGLGPAANAPKKPIKSLMATFKDFGASLKAVKMDAIFTDAALDLMDKTSKMSVSFGEGRTQANLLAYDIVDLSAATGHQVEGFVKLATAMSNTGQDFTTLSKGSRTLTNDSRVMFQTFGEQDSLGALVNTFGVGTEEVAAFAKSTQLLGGDVNGLLNQTAAFQAAFKMPGMIEALPGVTQTAMKSIQNFGTQVTGSSDRIITNTTQMGAVFSKTFGTTMKDGVDKVSASFEKFNEEQLNLRKLSVGLTTDFSPLVNTFLETGESLFSVQARLKEATASPDGLVKFAEHAVAKIAQLQAAGQDIAAERFRIGLMENAPEAVKAFIAMPGALKAARAEIERVNETQKENEGFKAFEDMVTGMRDTGKEAVTAFKNLIDLSKTVVGVLFEDTAKGIFADVSTDLKTFNQWLITTIKNLNDKNSVFSKEIKPTLISVGKVLAVIGAGATVAASAVGTLMGVFALAAPIQKGWTLLSSVFTSLGPLGTSLTGVFKGVVSFAGKLATKLLLPAMAVKSVITALMDMAAVFRDPNATGMEKFQAIFRGVFVGLGDFVDNLLLGIPSMLLRTFFPSLGDSFEQGMGGIADTAFTYISGMFSMDKARSLGTSFMNLFTVAADYLKQVDFAGIAHDLFRDVTTSVVGIVKFGFEAYWEYLKFKFYTLPKMIYDSFSSSGPSMFAPLLDFFYVYWEKLGDIGIGAIVGIGEGIANAFGMPLKRVSLAFDNMWLGFKVSLFTITDLFWDFVKTAERGMFRVGQALDLFSSDEEKNKKTQAFEKKAKAEDDVRQASIKAVQAEMQANLASSTAAQASYEKKIEDEKQQKKVAKAFKEQEREKDKARKKDEADKTKSKAEDSPDQQALKGKSAEIFAAANEAAEQRLQSLEESMKKSGASPQEIAKSVSEAGFEEIEKLDALRTSLMAEADKEAAKKAPDKATALAKAEDKKPIASATAKNDMPSDRERFEANELWKKDMAAEMEEEKKLAAQAGAMMDASVMVDAWNAFDEADTKAKEKSRSGEVLDSRYGQKKLFGSTTTAATASEAFNLKPVAMPTSQVMTTAAATPPSARQETTVPNITGNASFDQPVVIPDIPPTRTSTDSIVDTTKGGGAKDASDFAAKVESSGMSSINQDARDIVALLQELVDSWKSGEPQKVKVDVGIDKEKLLKVLKQAQMGKAFQQNGVGG